MNRLISLLQSIRLRQVVTVVMAAITIFVSSAFGNGNELQAQAVQILNRTDASAEQVDSATIKRIQDKAEDINSDKIGDTGLKNLKNLGKNIPKVIKQNAEETLNPDNPSAPGTRTPTKSDRK
ncbi:hypothetical protein [Microcoleus sp. FACHB-672]|uniref:hypothetical protein n=1 Tax=Microcoleus sp. FACHB-672 TaxID=2692825 RepID=UPI001681CF56|nr:hypothetical protein [Microcoleus sp. FACHB-672]MBD2039939.1 hypothetical protein [Microcoleus sp. FACHB-672]